LAPCLFDGYAPNPAQVDRRRPRCSLDTRIRFGCAEPIKEERSPRGARERATAPARRVHCVVTAYAPPLVLYRTDGDRAFSRSKRAVAIDGFTPLRFWRTLPRGRPQRQPNRIRQRRRHAAAAPCLAVTRRGEIGQRRASWRAWRADSHPADPRAEANIERAGPDTAGGRKKRVATRPRARQPTGQTATRPALRTLRDTIARRRIRADVL